MGNSAVEWLVNELTKNGHNFKLYKKEIEQAKEMENSQRQKDFWGGYHSICMEHENIEDYFKQYIKSER